VDTGVVVAGSLCAVVLLGGGLVLATNCRGVTYRLSWLGLRLQGYTSVPDRLVAGVKYRTRVGRAVGTFLSVMGIVVAYFLVVRQGSVTRP
jgi:hypothetical protein